MLTDTNYILQESKKREQFSTMRRNWFPARNFKIRISRSSIYEPRGLELQGTDRDFKLEVI